MTAFEKAPWAPDPSDLSTPMVWCLSVMAPGPAGGLIHWLSHPIDITLPGCIGPGSLALDELRDREGEEEGGVGVEVMWPESMALVEGAGHTLSGSPAELSLVSPDTGWGRRRVLVVGTVGEPSYGLSGEPVAFEVRPPTYDGSTMGQAYPLDRHEITAANLGGGSPPEGAGHFPLVYGAPGVLYDEDGAEEYWPGSPAPVADQTFDGMTEITSVDTLLACLGAPVGSSVTLLRTDPDTGDLKVHGLVTVDTSEDAHGQAIGTIDMTGESDVVRRSVPYHLSWSASAGTRPAWATDARAGWGLGSLVADLARRCGGVVDTGRMVAARPVLDAYILDTYIDEPTRWVRWVEDHVLGKYPVEMEHGSSGSWLRPVVWRPTPAEAVVSMTYGCGGVARVESGATVEVVSPANPEAVGVRVSYARRADTGEFLREALVGRDGRHLASVPVDAPVVEVDLPDVWRAHVAHEVARYLAWRDLRAHRVVAYRLDVSRWHWLEAGDVVLVTDSEMGLDEAVGVVEAVTRTDGPWSRVEVRLA